MKTATLERDANPYLELLHGALADEGVEPRYLAMPTPSRSLNILLIPLMLVRARLAGVRVLHVHWVFGLAFAGSTRFALVRRLSQTWFALILLSCRVLGVRIVWTAHNVLPHDPVFWDDRSARAALLKSSAHVIVHDAGTTAELAELVGGPELLPPVSVVPHASFAGHYDDCDRVDARARLGLPTHRRIVLFIGRVTAAKGATDLLDAFEQLDRAGGSGADAPLLVIAGRCADPRLREQLESRAAGIGDVRLDLRHLPDSDLADYVAACDAVVLPFRQVTTSGSAQLAMAFGRPVVVPDLAAFEVVPADACIRYAYGDPRGLIEALGTVCSAPDAALATAGAAGRAVAADATWPETARTTARIYRDAVQGRGGRR